MANNLEMAKHEFQSATLSLYQFSYYNNKSAGVNYTFWEDFWIDTINANTEFWHVIL